MGVVTDSKDAKDSKSSLKQPVHPCHPLQLLVVTNAQILDAEFTESEQIIPGSGGKTLVGNEPAYAPNPVIKVGITFKRDKCFNVTLTAVHVSEQFWQDSNLGSASIPPPQIPSYTVF